MKRTHILQLIVFILLCTASGINAQNWVKLNAGAPIPSNAVIGGLENNMTLYVARGKFNGTWHPGKTWAGAGKCNFGWGNAEKAATDYEVLTAPQGYFTWVTPSGNTLPANVFPGGTDGNLTTCPCQGKVANGSWHPGKTWAGAGRCNVGYGGKEVVCTEYTVLVTSGTPPPNTTTGPDPSPSTTSPSAVGAKMMPFVNDGTKTVTIYKTSATAKGPKVTDITNQGTVNIPVKIGDQFLVEIDGRTDLHPKVFITDLDKGGIIIHGNLPLVEYKSAGPITYEVPDYYPNLVGIDLTILNPRDLVSTINKAKIFEALDPANGVDYFHIGNKLVKYGFLYYGLSTASGSSSVDMSYGFNAFSSSYSGSVGADFPLPKGMSGSLNVGFNNFSNEEKSSTNVYTYTREQKQVFGVDVDPMEARLDSKFKLDVLQVNSVQDAKDIIIPKYGTHYPKTIIYGGDRSAYMIMTSDQYSKVKGYGVDVKASVSKSALQKNGSKENFNSKGKSTGSSDSYASSNVGSGSLSFAYEQNEEARSVLESTKSKYRQVGGTGGFDNTWEVSEGDAAPVGVILGLISDLIDVKIFKDATTAAQLAPKKAYIEQAIKEYLQGMASVSEPPAVPVVYSVEMSTFKVVKANDDGNRGLKGRVDAYFQVGNNAAVQLTPWVVANYYDPWSAMCFCPDHGDHQFSSLGGKKVYFTQVPESNGALAPIKLNVSAYYSEFDDNLADNSDNLYGSTGLFDIGNMQEGATITKEFYAYHDGNPGWNSILVKFKVTRLPSDFSDLVSNNGF